MAFYLITKNSTDENTLETPVFEIDDSQDASAALVFLSSPAAEEYIDAAGWSFVEVIARVESVQLLKWLILAKDNGITHVVVDADRGEQLDDQEQDTLLLDDPCRVHAELLKRLRLATVPANGKHSATN